MRAAAVAHRTLLLVLEALLGFLAAVSSLAAIDDDGHVRVVLVVVDHLVVELVGELARNDAVDHRRRIVGGRPAIASDRAGIRSSCCAGTPGGSRRSPARPWREASSRPSRSAAARRRRQRRASRT